MHDFERLVRSKCLHSARNGSVPLIMVQSPTWAGAVGERAWFERETQVMGFASSYTRAVLGWAAARVATTFEEYVRWEISSERHLGRLVLRLAHDGGPRKRMCELPPLPVVSTQEGSTGKMRDSL